MDSDSDADADTTSFHDLNGFLWMYNIANEIRFPDVIKDLDDLHDRGFRILGFYAPYEADPEKWLGSIAVEPYSTPTVSGTLEEWQALIDGAHARGMKVVAYFQNLVVDARSTLFTTAEEQYSEGDTTSPEVSAFVWAESMTETLPTPTTGPSEWRLSETAGAYYWSVWGEAGMDVTTSGGLAEVERFERFWLDTGLDGFMWDAGFVDTAFSYVMAELPATYTTNEKWLTFESTNFEEADSYAEFGLTSWFNLENDDTENNYSYVARGGDSADDLEEGLAPADYARSLDRLTHAWSLWEDEDYEGYPDEDAMRVQEAALLAGAGILYGIPDRASYETWPSARVYAMRRTSRDGTQTALLVYNFDPTPATVTMDLTDTGLIVPQTPKVFSASAMKM
jgi:hypothetical protein